MLKKTGQHNITQDYSNPAQNCNKASCCIVTWSCQTFWFKLNFSLPKNESVFTVSKRLTVCQKSVLEKYSQLISSPENLVDNQKCQARFSPLCNKILFLTLLMSIHAVIQLLRRLFTSNSFVLNFHWKNNTPAHMICKICEIAIKLVFLKKTFFFLDLWHCLLTPKLSYSG